MNALQTIIEIKTPGRGFVNITNRVSDVLSKIQVPTGLCHLFLHHTSASLILCENADPQVQIDLENFMQRIAPDGDPHFKHNDEGPDDMPAHVRTVLTQSFLIIPITKYKLALGTWQGIYLWEHRVNSCVRKLTVTISPVSSQINA